MKKTDGKTNAYILNLMRYYDNQTMNEYELKDRINKRFKYRLRANEVLKLHIKPLIKNNWLIEIKKENEEICYMRIGPIRYVRSEETLKNQFYDYPEEMWEYMKSHYMENDIIQEMWEANPDNLMTEEEYEKFWTKKWEEHLLEEKLQESNKRKLTSAELKDLYHSLGINDREA